MYCHQGVFYMRMVIVVKRNTESHNANLTASKQTQGLGGMPVFFSTSL